MLTATAGRWIAREVDAEANNRLCRELDLSPVTAQILVSRGHRDPAAVERFLNPSIDQLHDPKLLPDYEAAAAVLLGAKERGETIYVHGDYDVDGVTSASLLTRFLKRIGCTVIPHVPHRMREGYGIHKDAVVWAKEHGADVFLTSDCGISAHEQITMIREAGMVPVVTDHHEVGETLPDAAAVVNPHRSDSQYPFPYLSGVGVALKLCAGLAGDLGIRADQFYRAFLDLAVLGTVADVMPLVDENRVITSLGLPLLRDSKKEGLRALIAVSELSKESELTARHIGFQLGPRINAVGRVDDAAIALDLCLTEDANEATRLAQLMDGHNRARMEEQRRTMDEAVNRVLHEGLDGRFGIVVYDEAWHPGIVGLVAGKLVEQFRRPTFALSGGTNGNVRGSGRSFPGFNLAEALNQLDGLLASHGGHEVAAGCSLPVENVPAFKAEFERLAASQLTPEDLEPVVSIDAYVHTSTFGPYQAAELLRLAPFGNANEAPSLAIRGVSVTDVRPTRNPEHASFLVLQDGNRQPAMGFGLAESLQELQGAGPVDIAFEVDMNPFNGSRSFKWLARHIRMSAST